MAFLCYPWGMEALWVAAAFALGLLANRLGLPPLVGYLGAGFGLHALGFRETEFLAHAAEMGVLLLLFSVGLKLRLKDLLEARVLGVGGLSLLLFSLLALPLVGLFPLALALGFSSTVMVLKLLEDKRELTAYHGRLAIGILILQDLVAVGLLALYGAKAVSPWALLLLFFPLLRFLLAWLLEKSGHDELLVLFGLGLALLGGEGFRQLGLSPELGALFMGALLADHAKGAEMAKALWSLKEAFLVAFFLEIGMKQGLAGAEVGPLLGLLLLSLLKAPLFFLLFLLLGLRARTGFVAGVYLGNYSEFALIVGVALERAGLLPLGLATLALTVALSMVLSAPLARYSHTLYRRLEPLLLRLERRGPHPDQEPQSLDGATVLIVGMGRTGGAVYRVLEARGERPVGLDADPEKVERHRAKGRRVLYGDAEDPELWERLDLSGLKAVVLALPDLEAKLLAARWIKERGFGGLVAATSFHLEEDPALKAAGVGLLFHPVREAGERLAERVLEELGIIGEGAMAGHSKWAQIKRKKAANDLKRGKIISKHLRAIQAAARAGGSPYPEANVQLRNAIEAARADDVPMENIERLLAKLQGGGEGAEQYEEIVYEGYAPGGVAVLVYALTDNRNRTAGEVRHVFGKYGGSLGTSGSVAWQFEKRGVIVSENTEAAQEAAIELGALDLEEEGESLTIYTEPGEVFRIAEALKARGIRVEDAEVIQRPQNVVALPPEEAAKVLRLVEALEDLDDVQNVYTNLDPESLQVEA